MAANAARYNQRPPVGASPANVAQGTNTDAAVVYPAPADGVAHVLTGVAYSYSNTGTLAGGVLTILDGEAEVIILPIAAKGEGQIEFDPPLIGTPSLEMTVKLAGGGSAVTGTVNVLGHWTQPRTAKGEGIIGLNQGGHLDFSQAIYSGLL